MWQKFAVKVITVVDVLLAALLISVYVYILSDNLQEIEMEKRAKRDHIIIYAYVCVSILVQVFFAFQFFQVLSMQDEDEEDDENIEEQIQAGNYWLIAAYLLLFNFIFKTGVYSQRCNCMISLTLVLYMFSILFRIFAIYIVSSFVTKLESLKAEIIRKRNIENVINFHKCYNHCRHLYSVSFIKEDEK